MRKKILCKKICVVGAESTGTTTMAMALAKYYRTVWVPEFGRMYWEGKMHSKNPSIWQTEEFVYIANNQNRLEHALEKVATRILICDTDSFATSLWHERYLGFMSDKVDELSHKMKHDLYLLTDVDIPFVQDGTRDGEHIRHSMHQRFVDELKKRNKKYVILSGSHEARLKIALKECDRLLRESYCGPFN